MKSILLALLTIIMAFTARSQSKQVCFTYDDLPLVTYGVSDTVMQRSLMNQLIKSLTTYQIPAIGFVNEYKCYDGTKRNEFQVSLLRQWNNAGLDLGNHTYSHPDYNTTTFIDYSNDIIKGEIITSEILKTKSKQLNWFRHPYLHTGTTKQRDDSLASFLVKRKYKIAPVTVDNDDYLFALAYKRAHDKHDTTLANRIGVDYIAYMERKLLYFEKQSKSLFGREIPQVLLLHTSRLNAEFTDELAEMFQRNGYSFIPITKAVQDNAYQTPISAFGKWGISWVDRWALSMGKKGDFFSEEPGTPEYIAELAR